MGCSAGEKSKQALLDAAGKLFAQNGIERVKLSEIAREANIDSCMIHYHFGSKNGLIFAVVDQALERWKEFDMRKFYQQNKSLLDSRDGQCIFISGMVEAVFKTFGNRSNSEPAQSMLLQLLQYPHPLRDKIIELHIKPLVNVFCEIYAKITGNNDFESAFCWFMFLICPHYLHSASPGMIDLFHPQGQVSFAFERRLQHFTVNILLNGLGLK